MSNKYLYLNGGLRGPIKMERHDKEYFYGRPYSTGMDSYDLESWEQHKKDWKTHIESLPCIPIEGNQSFKQNQIYEEGKDFALERKNIFHPPTKEPLGNTGALDASHGYYESTVATPIDQSHKGFSEYEIQKVQQDIDSVNAGATVDKLKLSGFPVNINELCDVLQNTCQLLNGIKPDAVEEKWWSEWDESVLESLIKMLKQVQPHYVK